jgi:hypothetical protein
MRREIYMKPEIRMRVESRMPVSMKNIHRRLGSIVLSLTSASGLIVETAHASETLVHLYGFRSQKTIIFKFQTFS